MSSSADVAGVQVSTDHWIAGRRVPSSSRFAVQSPIDGTHLADVSAGGARDVDAAIDAAREAFPAWAALGPEGRAPVLRRFAEGIRSHAQQLAASRRSTTARCCSGTSIAWSRAPRTTSSSLPIGRSSSSTTIDGPEVTNHVRYEPAGVAALITPWNAPLMLTTWKVGPALAAGNTVVVKPPEWAPLTCSLLADIAHEAGVPAGVLNVVQGIGEEAGAALVAHGDVDRISFTGSPETGRLDRRRRRPEPRRR